MTEPQARRQPGGDTPLRAWPVDRGPAVAAPRPTRRPLREVLARARSEAVLRWVQLRPAAQALLIYLASRVFDFVILDRAARFQPASLWNGPDPGYLGLVSLWDGDWYRIVAENGYPDTLPVDPSSGLVRQNAWAFYPLFPLVTRGLMTTTGLRWPLAASIVTLSCAAVAVVVLRSLLAPLVGTELALWGVALFCFFPAAPVLQLAYTEGMAALLLFSVFWCLQRGRYLAAVPLVLMLGFTRALAAPLAAVVALHLLRSLVHRDRAAGGRRILSQLLLAAAACVAVVEWPLTAGWVTGRRSAYLDTMGAWRSSHQVTSFRPWLDISRFFFGYWFGPVGLTVILLALVVWLRSSRTVPIGPDLRLWSALYAGYLLAVLDPGTSIFRYCLMFFPLGVLLAAASSSRAYRTALVVASAAGQVVWVVWLWRFIPPSDWPP